ncbi:hypothetical protein AVEN_227606-1, partial [Araneus ventricosus]
STLRWLRIALTAGQHASPAPPLHASTGPYLPSHATLPPQGIKWISASNSRVPHDSSSVSYSSTSI